MEKVKIVEVSPRDGLQNERLIISCKTKAEFINRLSHTGLQRIEAASLVSPKWIPQMADSTEVMQAIERVEGVHYSALVPNMRGFETALATKATEVAIFTSVSEAFNQRNINCSLAESIERFKPILESSREQGLPVRAYISCALGCPYEGDISIEKVADLSAELLSLGCYEVSLSDTIGVGTPYHVKHLIQAVADKVPMNKIAVHFHDTYGQALVNIYTAFERGVRVFDSSVAGLGGCPYAKGASGNVATEDLVYMFEGMEVSTGVDLDKLVDVGMYICDCLGRENGSKVAVAHNNKRVET